MKHLKSFAIAFSMYSKIPVPIFPWKEEDMRYVMAYFPLVGAVICVLEILWRNFASAHSFGNIFYAAIAFAIPTVISGGIHIDGFIDTSDALHSYQPKEKKIEILKDPHTGAFAMISLALWAVLSFGAWSEVTEYTVLGAGLGFWLARIYSAIGVVMFPAMGKKGTVAGFKDTAQKRTVLVILGLQLAFVFTISVFCLYFAGIVMNAMVLAVFGWYHYKSNKEFGGINGDLAGWFVTISECVCVIIMAVFERL